MTYLNSKYISLLIVIFYLVLHIFSCDEKKDPTQLFESYLKNCCDINLTDSATTFLILTKKPGCIGCKNTIAHSIEFGKVVPSIVCIIPPNTNYDTTQSSYKKNIFIDYNNDMAKLGIVLPQIALIKTSAKKIKSITPIETSNMDSILPLIQIK